MRCLTPLRPADAPSPPDRWHRAVTVEPLGYAPAAADGTEDDSSRSITGTAPSSRAISSASARASAAHPASAGKTSAASASASIRSNRNPIRRSVATAMASSAAGSSPSPSSAAILWPCASTYGVSCPAGNARTRATNARAEAASPARSEASPQITNELLTDGCCMPRASPVSCQLAAASAASAQRPAAIRCMPTDHAHPARAWRSGESCWNPDRSVASRAASASPRHARIVATGCNTALSANWSAASWADSSATFSASSQSPLRNRSAAWCIRNARSQLRSPILRDSSSPR